MRPELIIFLSHVAAAGRYMPPPGSGAVELAWRAFEAGWLTVLPPGMVFRLSPAGFAALKDFVAGELAKTAPQAGVGQ